MLENILIEYFNLSREWYNLNESDKEIEWNNAYNNLIDLIYALENLGVLESSSRIVDKLDEIHERGV